MFILAVCFCAALLLLACSQPELTQEEVQATQIALDVEVQRSVAATLTASAAQPPEAAETPAPPTATSTKTPADVPVEATATPTPAPTETPTSPPTATPTAAAPTATPTRFSRVVRGVNGSDNASLYIRGPLDIKEGRYVIVPGFSEDELDDEVVFRDRAVFQVEVSDTTQGSEDGYGIQAVEFQISDFSGLVHSQVEQVAPFCAFGGNDPLCPSLNFAQVDYRWPGGKEIQNGFHDVTISITTTDNVRSDWFWSFEIDNPVIGGATGEPVELVLRPACGTNLSVPAGTPIDLVYGIWATRGYDRAVANEPYITIDMTIDGQPVSGDRQLPPVADLPQAICGRDYNDSYWVSHTVRLDPLSPGQHPVRIVYGFTQTIQDGYGGAYYQPFTQEFVITAQ
jgi:hypothetical protein